MADHETLPHLDGVEDTLTRCFRCGLCRTVCPSFEEIGLEGASPRGRIQFANAVRNGIADLDDAVERRMLDCLTCMRCGEVCPAGVETHKVVIAARAELVDRGRLHPVKKAAFKTVFRSPRLMALSSKLAAGGQTLFSHAGNILDTLVPHLAGMEDKRYPDLAFRQAHDRLPERIAPVDGSPRMRVGYFIGCATNLVYPEIADATIDVLTRNGVEVVIPRGQACCGIPAYTSGDMATARLLAEKNQEVFGDLDVDFVITDCTSCSAALKHEVAQFVGIKPISSPVLDLTEFLVDTLNIPVADGGDVVRVTYHDPCHLSRAQHITDAPRDILRRSGGVDLVELSEPERCCGGAGVFTFTHHELARKVGVRKTADIRGTGATVVATPCPACRMQIEDLLAHEGLAVDVRHPVELYSAACRTGGVPVTADTVDGDTR